MKYLFTTIMCCISVFTMHAQTEHLIKLNHATGNFTKIKKIDNVRWISGATITYDQANKNIIFCGTSAKNNDSFKLYSVNTQTGNTVASPPFKYNPTPFGFTYNKTDGKFYAFRWNQALQKEYLITADLTTGVQTDVMEITDLVAFYNMGITFDDKNQLFYINGKKGSTGSNAFFIVDLRNLSTRIKPMATNAMGMFQYDNALEKIFCTQWLGINNDFTLNTIDTNGIITPIGIIPKKLNGWTPEVITYDQKNHHYIFCGRDTGYKYRIYTINTTDASIVHNPFYPTTYKPTDSLFDNVIFPVYDESLDSFYALHWEAKTPKDTTDPDTTLAVDIIPKQPKQDCITAPTAFSPNGDGRNDEFHVITLCNISTYHMQVFNRRGQKVFETDNIRQGWNGYINGEPAGMDTYVYMLQYQTTNRNIIHTLTGNITLVR